MTQAAESDITLNTHGQSPHGMAKCDESKHDIVAFQLAAADFGSNSL